MMTDGAVRPLPFNGRLLDAVIPDEAVLICLDTSLASILASAQRPLTGPRLDSWVAEL